MFRTGVGVIVFSFVDADYNRWGINPNFAVIVVVVACIPRFYSIVKVGMIKGIPMGVVSVVIVPVVWSPWLPVSWIITPVPCRTPYYISWCINESNYRPGCNLIGVVLTTVTFVLTVGVPKYPGFGVSV